MMAAAVNRPSGFGAYEDLTPEEALALYTGTADAPGTEMRRVAVGEPADVCVIDCKWSVARGNLGSVRVRYTLVDGRDIYQSS